MQNNVKCVLGLYELRMLIDIYNERHSMAVIPSDSDNSAVIDVYPVIVMHSRTLKSPVASTLRGIVL